MAIKGLKKEQNNHFELIHHSDRGVQYCQNKYVKLLQDNDINKNKYDRKWRPLRKCNS